MKKLIIACAVATMAVAANAAASSWKVTGGNFLNGTGSTDASAKYSGTAYVFDSSIYSMKSIYDALVADSSYDAADASVASLTIANGTVSNGKFDYGTAKGDDGSLNTYSFYLAIIDGDKVYFSNELANMQAMNSPTEQTLAFQSQNNGTTTFSANSPTASGFAGAGHWSSIPEPTGAMLIALGVAALALRRGRR